MSSELARVDEARNATMVVTRPDGTKMEYVGPAEELTVILSQLEPHQSPWLTMEQLQRWAIMFNRLQPLMWGVLTVCAIGLMLSWVMRPADQYQPQSLGGHHARMV